MKTAILIATLALVGAIASAVLLTGSTGRDAQVVVASSEPERPLVFIPGLLGSRLCHVSEGGVETVAWGTVDAMGQFPTLAISSDEADIAPCGLIREISFLGVWSQTVYGPFMDRLLAAGYREGETLFVFDYDWRLSVIDNADRLAEFISSEVPDGRFDIVGHSMGGLVARTYAASAGEEGRIDRLIAAGSPWRGSVQLFELLHGGWGIANPLLGGLDAFRATVVSFPSTFELAPHYDGCCTAAGFDLADPAAWGALNWPGIAADQLPDLAEVERHRVRLSEIVDQPLPTSIEEAVVIGVDQRTPEQFDLQLGNGEAQLGVRTSWDGDGTVMRDSASLPGRIVYTTSFATHDAILNDPAVQDFVLTTLADGPDVAADSVPVRKRSSILTALGEAVELIGVAVATDQPAYRAGSVGKLTVHLRLPVADPVDSAALHALVTLPDATAVPAALTPDPAASDPANPLEQSYSAAFQTGLVPGDLRIDITLSDSVGEPRAASRVVPVLTP